MSSRTKYSLLLVTVLGIVLRYTAGYYDPGALAVLTLAMIGMALFIYFPQFAGKPESKEHTLDLALVSLVLLFAYGLYLDPILDFVPLNRETGELPEELTKYYYLHASTLLIMPVLAGLLWLQCLTRGNSPAWLRPVLIVLAVTALVVQRIVTVIITPYADIDVWVSNQDACGYLLDGKNPYPQYYRDIYAGLMGYKPGFGYWPGYLYWATPFKFFFGDVRYSSVFSDLMTGLAMVLIGHKLKVPLRTASLFPLVWLTFPVGMFVTEHAWIDPNLICFISMLVLAILYQRWIVVGVIAGWIAGTKQYGGLVGLLTLVYMASQQREQLWRFLLVSGTTFAALLVPFLVLDARKFYESTIGVLAGAPLRKDPLSLIGLWLNVRDADTRPEGQEWVAAFSVAANFMAVGVTCVWLFCRRNKSPLNLIGGLMLCYFVFFFTGKFAFCNYYYLVSSLAIAYFILSLGEDLKTHQSATPEGTV